MTKHIKRIKVCSVCNHRFSHPSFTVGKKIQCENQTGIIETRIIKIEELHSYPIHFPQTNHDAVVDPPEASEENQYFTVVGWSSDSVGVGNHLRHLRYRKSGSESSRHDSCLIIRSLCKFANMGPDDMIKLSRERIERLVGSWADMKSETTSKGTANLCVRWARTFFRANGFNKENGKELRLPYYYVAPRERIRKQRAPLLHEALKMAERAGSKRDRAIIYMLLCTGLRNSTLRSLNVGDIREELEKGQIHLQIRVTPELKDRLPGATKGRIPYHVFTSAKATEAIRKYLKEREEMYGSIQDDEPLFITGYNQLSRSTRQKTRLSQQQLLQVIKKCAEKAELTNWEHVHVHSFRTTFRGVLRNPLSDGTSLDPEDADFFMGHVHRGAKDHYYDWLAVEELRKKYAKIVFDDLSSVIDISKKALRRIATYLGIDIDKIIAQKKNLGIDLTAEEEEKLIADIIAGRRHFNESYEVRTVSELELAAYLAEGWEKDHQMKDGNIIIKRRNNYDNKSAMKFSIDENVAKNNKDSGMTSKVTETFKHHVLDEFF